MSSRVSSEDIAFLRILTMIVSVIMAILGMVLLYDGIKVVSQSWSFVFETLGIVCILVSIGGYLLQRALKKKAANGRL